LPRRRGLGQHRDPAQDRARPLQRASLRPLRLERSAHLGSLRSRWEFLRPGRWPGWLDREQHLPRSGRALETRRLCAGAAAAAARPRHVCACERARPMSVDATPLLRLYARRRLAMLAREDAVAAQTAQLLRLVRAAQETRFGAEHDFAA